MLVAVEKKIRPSPSAMAVLSLLAVGPLHPYGMQRLIRLWGKDQVVNVGQRANLYKTINRLRKAGLVIIRQTERDQLYPERTVYELTEEGRQQGEAWLSDMLATPRNEFPEFPAALSFAMLLGPGKVLAVFEQRAAALRGTLARLEGDLEKYSGTLPRVAQLETEYQRAMTAAELNWLDSVTDDLRAGDLTWTEELAGQARSFLPDQASPDQLLR